MFAVYIVLFYQYKFNNTDRRYGNLVGGLNLSRSPWEQVGLSHKTEKKKKSMSIILEGIVVWLAVISGLQCHSANFRGRSNCWGITL